MVWRTGNTGEDSYGWKPHDPVRTVNGIRIVGASRKPCPVCGDLTGDCSADSHADISIVFEDTEK